MPRLARWVLRLAIVLLPLSWPQRAAAADDAIVLKVRGKSQLRLRDVSRRPDGKSTFRVTLQLQLSDGVATDAPGSDDRAFVDRLVTVQLRSSEGTLYLADKRTGDDGLVTFERDGVPPAAYTVTATFKGDELRDAALGIFAMDVGRQATQLRVQAPARIALSDELPLRLTLTSEGQPFEGEVELGLGRRRERLKLRQGYGELRLPATLLGKSGDKLELVAQFAGTRLYAPVEVRQELLLVSQATVTLQALGVGPEVAQGSRLTVIGLVRDEEGPLSGELLELEALSDETSQPSEPSGKRSLGHALTDNLGRFEITVPKLLLPTGAALLSAQVFPRRGHILPGRSPELALLVLPPEPISVLYFLLPLGVTGALWLGYVLGRRLVQWLRVLWQDWKARQVKPVEPTVNASASQSSISSHSSLELHLGEPGVRLTQQRRLSTLRRAVENVIDGQVSDSAFGVPVAATISVVADGSEQPLHTLSTGPSGAFATPSLAAGRYQLRIAAPGYLSQQFFATLPHRGEYRQVAIRLEPLRARLLAEWRRVAEGILGESVTTKTPRELAEHFPPGPSSALAEQSQRRLIELTTLVENAYYSPRTCTPEMLVSAAQLADAILSSEKTATKAADLRTPGAPRPLIQQPRT